MTQEQEEQVAKHFGELYSIAIGLTPNIPDDISEAMKMAYMAGADYAIDMFAMNWISVDDELPPKESEYEDNSIVVLATDGNNVYKGLYRSGEYLSGWFTCDLWELDDITHWMPMPQPPSSSEIPNNYKEGGEQ